jgi:hypothetical protein
MRFIFAQSLNMLASFDAAKISAPRLPRLIASSASVSSASVSVVVSLGAALVAASRAQRHAYAVWVFKSHWVTRQTPALRLPRYGLGRCEYRDVFNPSLGIHGTAIFKIRHGMRLRVGCIP